MAVPGFNGIVDISHHNEVASFETLREAASAPSSTRPPRGRPSATSAIASAAMLPAARACSGAPIICKRAPVATQVSNFLAHADPRPDD